MIFHCKAGYPALFLYHENSIQWYYEKQMDQTGGFSNSCPVAVSYTHLTDAVIIQAIAGILRAHGLPSVPYGCRSWTSKKMCIRDRHYADLGLNNQLRNPVSNLLENRNDKWSIRTMSN